MKDDLTKRALACYKAPFRYHHGYIWDANQEMVADRTEQALLTVRGWGRLQHLRNPEALQDRIGELIAECLNAAWKEAR